MESASMKNWKQLEMEKYNVEKIGLLIFGWGSCGNQVGKQAIVYTVWHFLTASLNLAVYVMLYACTLQYYSWWNYPNVFMCEI